MVVGLVGCGRWGQHILRDLRELGCEVPVVARSQESVERARQGGASAIVGSVEGLAGAAGIVVATPTSTHAEVVEHSLALGARVFCEKPLCHDPDDATRLAELAPDRLFVMDKWRYHPGVLALARIGREGSLGAVRGLRTTRVNWGTKHDDVDAVWVLAPHDLAIALEVLGRLLPPRGAIAEEGSRGHDALVGLMSDGGMWHVLDVSSRSPSRIRRVELHCAEGVAVLAGGWDEHVTVYRDTCTGEPVAERIDTPGELPLAAELRAFVTHLEGGPPPRSSAEEGAHVVGHVAALRSLAG
jgi:predicted dehydrogenase